MAKDNPTAILDALRDESRDRARGTVGPPPEDRSGCRPVIESQVPQAGPTDRGIGVLPVLWPRLTLFLFGMVVIFAAIELVLAITERGEDRSKPKLYRRPAPYVEFYQSPNFDGGGITTNDQGFRYGPLSTVKPPGETRIFFLSSSLGFKGSTNASTIPGMMEKRLAERGATHIGRVRVINASGVSFGPTQSLMLLVTKILEYAPDMLVVFHGPEALYIATRYQSIPGYPFNFSAREYLQDSLPGKLDRLVPPLAPLLRTRTMSRFHPDLLRVALNTRLPVANAGVSFQSLSDYDPYIDRVVEDVGKIIRIASAYGARVLVAVPPAHTSTILPGAVARLAERVRGRVEDASRARAQYVDTVQLASELTARHLWNGDGLHWNDEGNRLIADHLLAALGDPRVVSARP